MKTKTFTPIGALHPILFFAGVYIVVLFFSIFICSSLFYSCNANSTTAERNQKIPVENQAITKTTSTVIVKH